jgi:acetylglutamate kinase
MPTGFLYLDERSLEDLLFIDHLARTLKQIAAPLVLVHGSGGRAERLLEAEGYVPRREKGVLQVQSAQELTLVERGIRETNQRLVAELSERLLPAVGIQGVDRGLLRRTAEGTLEVGRVDWLCTLLTQGIWPVLSTLARQGTHIVEVAPAEMLSALAKAWPLGAVQILLLTDPKTHRPAADEVAHRCLQEGIPLWIGPLEDLPKLH